MYLPTVVPEDVICHILLSLQFPAHRIGFQQLCLAIPQFARDTTQSLTKDLYPYIAKAMGYEDWRAVEHSIRDVIAKAWEKGDRQIWELYFPGAETAPSNKRFIATMARFIR